MTAELYKKHRPTSLKQLIGQDAAVKALVAMGKTNSIPQTLLLTGPSGCGKTTIARILKRKLKCSDNDFREMNAADYRGIDDIRDIRQVVSLSPMEGECRIWLIDEAHQLTSTAQEGFLKLLEDTPENRYFFLASTDPQKLKKTIITRSTEIKLKLLSKEDSIKLVERTLEDEGKTVSKTVIEKIAEVAEGSARKVMVLLHKIIGVNTEEGQLEILEDPDAHIQAIAIARALLNEKTNWKQMAEILKGVDEDTEKIRWMVLGYCSKVALGRPSRACMVIEEFRDNLYESKKAGLISCCYNVIKG